MRVLHIIVSLHTGGAERTLQRLVSYSNHTSPVEVVTLVEVGAIGEALRLAGIVVHNIGMVGLLSAPRAALRLRRIIHAFKPDIVQTWMYHSDFIGGLVSRLMGIRAVVWSVRNTQIPRNSRATKLLVKLNAKLSGTIPHRIVYCAHAALHYHVSIGFNAANGVVIHNGYESTSVASSSKFRAEIRSELGIGTDELVVGSVGRFDSLKDYPNMLSAFEKVSKQVQGVRFLMVGNGIELANSELTILAQHALHSPQYILLGARNDIPRIMRAIDVFCLSSLSEGFPNVVAEAMAEGVPCVVTDVGDARLIVGDCGIVVPSSDSGALASGMVEMLKKSKIERETIGFACSKRIRDHFSIESAAQKFTTLYKSLLNDAHAER
jgi:glycosyltransferase involved in cell wall biosynthesis